MKRRTPLHKLKIVKPTPDMRIVYIELKTAGDHFATYAVVRDQKTKRKLHETTEVPYKFDEAAVRLAEDWIIKRGYVVEDFIEIS